MNNKMNTDCVTAQLSEAMARHELQAYYQPQYDALTHKLTGAEALVRWIRPDGTVTPPGQFIPVLEQSESILSVDWYMLQEICMFIKHQQALHIPQIPISINFSRWHVREKDCVDRLCRMVDQFQIDHAMLEIEITESAFVEQAEKMASLIARIRDAGFRIAIDDFGSGLSSLSFVKDISADVLKIDKSLLSKNCEDEKERIVLESIFMFAHRLNLTTVAEGVETKEQLAFLRTCDCKRIQGFIFARPMPSRNFLAVCQSDTNIFEPEDILKIQAPSSATQLLLEAIFIRYPLVIFANLTRNSFYMMAYDNFSSRSCPSAGIYDELIQHGAATMYPEDREIFRHTFSIPNQLAAYKRGDKSITLVTRQLGDDNIYRKVETVNYFVKNPSADDVLVITLCHNLD